MTAMHKRTDIESVEVIAERFDLPVQWAQLHIGPHRCVDDRMYRVSCLVSDPSCDQVARSYMAKRAQQAAKSQEDR